MDIWQKCAFIGFLCGVGVMADNMILDFETIKRIELKLKPNQTLMIDHKTGALLGVMEVMPNGKVKKMPIPKHLIGKDEADVTGKSRNRYETKKSGFGGNTTIYYKLKGKPKSATGKEKAVEAPNSGIFRRTTSREWNKKKIIYEQKNETLKIIR